MTRPRRLRRREPDVPRVVMALLGLIVLPMLLIGTAILLTTALLGNLLNV